MEILDEDDAAFPSALPVRRELPHTAWVTIQIGCDNACAFCIVPAVRGKEISRPFDEMVAEVEALAAAGTVEVTLLGQNVNSYGRDLTRRRPLFAELLRAVGAVDGIRRVRFTSPHPKDLRPETIEAMADVAAACEHLHLPLQSGSDRVLAAMHRGYTAARYLEKLAAARAAVPDLAVTTDLIVGFPGETDDDFERTLEVVAEAAYDSAYTFVFSPRPGHRGGRRWPTGSCPRRSSPSGSSACGWSSSARPWPATSARIGRVEEVLVEGPSKKDPAVATGRTRQNKLVHFAVDGVVPAAGTFADCARSPGAAAHHLRGELVEVTARPRHRTRSRWSRSDRRHPAAEHLALVGSTASGKSALALEVARRLRRLELVSADSMQVYRGMDVGTAKPTPAERAEVPHHLLDVAEPEEDFAVARFQAAVPRLHRRHRGPGPAGAARGRHRALRAGGRRRLALPGQWPEVRADLEDEAPARGGPPSTAGWPSSTPPPRPASSRGTSAGSSGPWR